MITFIQKRILKPGMVSHFTRSRSTKAFICLPEAHSIGIMADVRQPGSVQPIVSFARSIHKTDRRCHVILLVPEKRKELVPYEYEKNFPGMPVQLICLDDLSIFKVPKKELTQPFTTAKFDIIFLMETAENFSLETILYHSQAKMFAGAAGLCSGLLDFEIELNERSDMQYLAGNLIKYLEKQTGKPVNQSPDSDKFILF